jgi:nucleoside-diphosphate-sugar epimerase
MIVGNGLVAKAFFQDYADDEEVMIFASGVSNSKENREEEFLREKQLLTNALEANKFMVYFSTCSVDDPELFNTHYVVHKKKMEAIVRGGAQRYAIFRLPQVVGKTRNPNTLTNYLYQQIVSGFEFQIWRYAKRNLIDVDDVASISNHLISNSLSEKITVSIASLFSISIPDLVGVFESVLGKKANYTIVDAGGAYEIDVERAVGVANHLGIDFDEIYIERLIRKYYGG